MCGLEIRGGKRLYGDITVSGAKNAALPLLSAALLTRDEVVIHNCPRILDVHNMAALMEKLGARVSFCGSDAVVSACDITSTMLERELASTIRSSVFLIGPLAGRMGEASFCRPGGCDIGKRPIDQHIDALKEMGASFSEKDGVLTLKAGRLLGARIHLSFPSVGATENAIMAAVCAKGTTVIENAAREPEIADMCSLLEKMGAHISFGCGTVIVEGVSALHGAEHTCMPDRIEAGTYMAAVAAAGGVVHIKNARVCELEAVAALLNMAGAKTETADDGIDVAMKCRPNGFVAATEPYPGFPTDMQAQICAVAAVSDGISVIEERVFDNRMSHCRQLMRAGADIRFTGGGVVIKGRGDGLLPSEYTACDLRSGAAFIIAALTAGGRSVIHEAEKIDRGYEDIEGKLSGIGAKVRRI